MPVQFIRTIVTACCGLARAEIVPDIVVAQHDGPASAWRERALERAVIQAVAEVWRRHVPEQTLPALSPSQALEAVALVDMVGEVIAHEDYSVRVAVAIWPEVVAQWADRVAVSAESAHCVRVIRGVPARPGRGERGKSAPPVMVYVARGTPETLATDHDGMGPPQSRRVTIRHGTDRITEVTVLSTDPAVGEIAEPGALPLSD